MPDEPALPDATATASHEGLSAAADDDAPLGPRAGDRIGRYVVERELGAGGMGVVVEAHDPELARRVALKLVRPDVGDRAYRQRLVQEARAMAQLEHPNVVRVYDAGLARGEVFVAMELVRGESLGRWMRAAPRPWREVLARFVEAGRGLAAAHEAGLVHRDFKPDNVLVRDSDKRACVTDFGLAIPAGLAPADLAEEGAHVSGDDATVPAARTPARATRTGAIVGTPPYMAPEQHAGGEIDRRADVFSFCVSAYEGVYGERPFAAAPDLPRHVAWAEAIAAGVIRPAPRGRRVPAAVRKALVRGLAVDPAARWPSMEPLLAALERALARRKRIAIGAAAVIAVAAVGALLVIARARPDDACAADASSLAERWAARRPGVRTALVATGKPWAAGQAARAESALDRYAGEWGTVRETGCRDAARGALAPDAWRARRACLDQAAIAFDARVDLLAQGGDDAVAHAVDLARPPSLASCLDPASDGADRAGDAAILGFIAQLEAARGLYDAGRYRDAERTARALRDRATAAGDRVEAAGAALVIAGVDVFYSEKLDEAEQLARDTAVSASATRDDWRAAEAWRFVLDAKAQGGHLDGLDYAITAARAAAARTDAEQQIVIDAAAGDALVRAQRFDDARALCEPALRHADQALGPGDVARDDALTCMADLSSRSGREADALRFASRAVGEQVARYGPRHPLVADALHNYGVTLDHSGDVRDELVVRWCAHALIVEQQGKASADAGESLAGLAVALSQTGDAADRAAARAALDRANAILPVALPADDPRLITFRSMRAYTLDGIGDHDAAIAAYAALERDLEGLRPVRIDLAIVTINYSDALRAAHRCAVALPIDDRVTPLIAELPRPLTIFVEGARAGCRLDTGRAADAARDLGAAWAALDPSELAPPDRGGLEAILAHALDASGGDRAHALAIAKQARADLGAAPDADLDRLIAKLAR